MKRCNQCGTSRQRLTLKGTCDPSKHGDVCRRRAVTWPARKAELQRQADERAAAKARRLAEAKTSEAKTSEQTQ